jgi:hypothetical protein
MFERNKNLVACGPYVSCEKHPHIQSFMIVLDQRGLSILSKTWRCKLESETRGHWVENTEVVIMHSTRLYLKLLVT